MTIIVEDGTIVAGANSYVTTTELTTFATARSITLVAGAETLLIQAMDYIESLQYKGGKRTQDQVLQWPRVDVYIDGYYFSSESIPQQLKDGLCHYAIAVDQGTDSLQDVTRQTTTETVGEISVQYKASSVSATTNIKVAATMYKLLESGSLGGIKVSKA